MAENNESTNVGVINLLLKLRTNIEEQINESAEKAKATAAKPFEEVGNKISESIDNGMRRSIDKTMQNTQKKFEKAGENAAQSFSKKFNASISKKQATLKSMEKQLEEIQGKIDEKVFSVRNNYKDVALDRDTLDAITDKTLGNDKAFKKMAQQEEKLAERVRLYREKLGYDIQAFEEKKVQAAAKAAKKQADIEQREADKRRKQEERKELAAQKAREKMLRKSTRGIRTLGKNIMRAFKSVFLMTAVYAAFKTLRSLFASATTDSKKFTDSLNTVKANIMAAFTPIVSAVMPMLEALMAKLAQITTAITSFIAGIFGKTYSQVMSKTKKLQSAAGKDSGGSLAGFDEINQLSSQKSDAGGVDFSAVSKDGDKAATVLGEKFRALVAKFQAFISPVKEGLSSMFEGGVKAFFAFRDAIGPGMLHIWQNVVLPIITWWRDTFAEVFSYIGRKLDELTIWFSQRSDTITKILKLLGDTWKAVWNNVIKPVSDTLKKYLGEVIDWLLIAFGGVADFLLGVFSGDWKLAFQGLLNVAVGMANAVIAAFEGILNAAVKAINGLLKMIRDTKLGEFIEDKLNIRMKVSSVSIPRIPVPQLATGGIINQPTLGLMGEYAGAYNNPEIVSPQSIMLDTFMQAVAPLVESIKQLIANTQTGQTIHIHLDGSMSALARIMKPYLDEEAKRCGVKIVVEE